MRWSLLARNRSTECKSVIFTSTGLTLCALDNLPSLRQVLPCSVVFFHSFSIHPLLLYFGGISMNKIDLPPTLTKALVCTYQQGVQQKGYVKWSHQSPCMDLSSSNHGRLDGEVVWEAPNLKSTFSHSRSYSGDHHYLLSLLHYVAVPGCRAI